MPEFDLNAELRTDVGKGASRRLRRVGKLPAIVYGGDKEPTTITLDQNELARRLEHEAFYSHVLTLRFGGESENVVLKDILRHPYRRQVLHVDLQRVTAGRKLHMHVPLHFVNEEASPGRKAGGTIAHTMNELEVSCLPADLPEFITVDLAGLELGEAIHLSALVLPEGVELAHPVTPETDRPVVSVHRHGGEETAGPAAEAPPGTGGA